jgi:phage-related baseplate assembly protein
MNTSPIDLSKLPPPQAVEEISYEAILAARLDWLDAKFRELGIMPGWDKTRQSDLVVIQAQEAAYREFHFRKRVNAGLRACMLALATGTNLDQLAANVNTYREILTPADMTANPPVAEVTETNDRLRLRAQMAFEKRSTAGPDGAYIARTLDASPRVADVRVDSPIPGDVVVTALAADNDGVADDALLACVRAALSGDGGDGVRPLTDRVTVQAATPVNYAVDADLDILSGPDPDLVVTAAIDAVNAFTSAQRKLGETVTVDGLHAALRVSGVRKVTLNGFAEIDCTTTQFPRCTAVTVRRAAAEA